MFFAVSEYDCCEAPILAAASGRSPPNKALQLTRLPRPVQSTYGTLLASESRRFEPVTVSGPRS